MSHRRVAVTTALSSGSLLLILCSAPVGVLAPALAQAQVADHLQCYAIKDPLVRTGANAVKTYTADLNGLRPEPGCVIKLPAKYACVQTTKENVQPAPPGAPAGPEAGRFLCYPLKCTKATLPPVAVDDQFGSRAVTPGRAKLLCAPATAPSTTTTITTTTSCPPATAFYCGGTGDCGGIPAICGTGGGGGLCPQGMTCTSTGPGLYDCACTGAEIPCGDPRLGGLTCNFCQWGTCPPGMTCGGVPRDGGCGYDCACH